MAPTIRIDDDVYAWLQKNARPFEDTPNSVLRRVAGLDSASDKPAIKEKQSRKEKVKMINLGNRIFSGRLLNQKWGIGARHALYHKDGHWYNNLERFPGALCDPRGYVKFETEEEYRNCPNVTVGEETNVRGGISSIPDYVRVT